MQIQKNDSGLLMAAYSGHAETRWFWHERGRNTDRDVNVDCISQNRT